MLVRSPDQRRRLSEFTALGCLIDIREGCNEGWQSDGAICITIVGLVFPMEGVVNLSLYATLREYPFWELVAIGRNCVISWSSQHWFMLLVGDVVFGILIPLDAVRTSASIIRWPSRGLLAKSRPS